MTNAIATAVIVAVASIAVAATTTTQAPNVPSQDPLETHPGIPNYYRLRDDIITAGQPEDGAWIDLKKAGFETIINLRTEQEGSLEERAKVEAAGLTYVNIPIGSGPGEGFTPEKLQQFAEAMNRADRGPVVVHCASSNRVGAMWYIHQVLDNGVAEDQAMTEGKAAGLTSERLAETARDYVQTKKKK